MKKNLLILLSLLFFTPFVIKAEELKIDWQNNWGGNYEDVFYELLQTEDGGFIANGYSYSTDIEGLPNKGDNDAIIVKYDKDGNLIWQKSWGGNSRDYFENVLETEDGGFIVNGYSSSTDIEGLPYKGDNDAIIVKYDKDGNLMWQKNWGGSDYDRFISVTSTEDGGFIVNGYSSSTDIEGLPNKGNIDAIIVKYDKDGNLMWQKNWGGNNWDEFNGLLQTKDGGFIVNGYSRSTDIEGLPNKGNDDAIIVKYDKDGNLMWQKNCGGNADDRFYGLLQTKDGGFIVNGYSNSTDIEGLPNKRNGDLIIVKYDKDGNIIFIKNFVDYSFMNSTIIKQSNDDGFVINGCVYEDDKDVCLNYGYAHLTKIDKNGNVVWIKSYKNENDVEHWWGSSNYYFNSIEVLNNNNILVSVYSCGWEQGMDEYDDTEDAMIIIYDKDGNMISQKSWGGNSRDYFENVFETEDGDFIAKGRSYSTDIEGLPNKGIDDAIIVKYSFEYNIENVTTKNGISTVKQQGSKGIITPTPNEGYEVDKIIIKDKDGNVLDVEVTKQEEGTYSFELYTDVSVEVIYKEKIENPKTGILDVITIIFVGLFISLSGFVFVKRYNERFEF